MLALSVTAMDDITKKYTLYATIFLLIIGLISNLFLVLIFVTLRVFRGNRCAFFLTMESIANIGLLLSNFPSFIYSSTIDQDLASISIIWCKLQSALTQIFGLCSLFTICFLTFDQFMSTNPRPYWRQISTLKLARRFTFFNICFVILHSIPFLAFSQITKTGGCTIKNPILNSYLTFFYCPILSCFISITVCLTFSKFAYCNVRRIVRRQISVVRRRLDHQLTAMVLARAFCLVLLGLPCIIYSLYLFNVSITENNQLRVATASLVGAIAYSLLYGNFSVRRKILF